MLRTSVVGTKLCRTGSREFPDYSTVENTKFGSPKTKPNGNDLQLMYKYRSDNLHCEVNTYTVRSGPLLYKQFVLFAAYNANVTEQRLIKSHETHPICMTLCTNYFNREDVHYPTICIECDMHQ